MKDYIHITECLANHPKEQFTKEELETYKARYKQLVIEELGKEYLDAEITFEWMPDNQSGGSSVSCSSSIDEEYVSMKVKWLFDTGKVWEEQAK